MKKRIPYTLLILILLGIFCYSAWQVGSYLLDAREQKEKYDQLAAMVEQVQATADTIPATEGTEPSLPEVPEATEAPLSILPEYEALVELNSDTVGWLKIDGTYINYPVMQSPMEPEYYLHRNFYFEHSERGCIFAKEECDVVTPSDNVTLYGHNMKDGSMFATLSNYTSQSYWQSHDTVIFDSLYEHRTYKIFAVFKTTAKSGQGFAYHTFIDAAHQEEFDSFISRVKELSLYDTGITPEYGDKLLCLSTCEYSQADGRLVVVAVLNPETTEE